MTITVLSPIDLSKPTLHPCSGYASRLSCSKDLLFQSISSAILSIRIHGLQRPACRVIFKNSSASFPNIFCQDILRRRKMEKEKLHLQLQDKPYLIMLDYSLICIIMIGKGFRRQKGRERFRLEGPWLGQNTYFKTFLLGRAGSSKLPQA